MAKDYEFDVFISHVSEDKDAVARPLAEELRAAGLKVWYDEFEIGTGESIPAEIGNGIRKSRYGIAVFSQQSLPKKTWAEEEVRAFQTRQTESGQGVALLPVLHELPIEKFKEQFPVLGTRLCESSDDGIEALARRLIEIVSPGGDPLPDSQAKRRAGDLLAYLPDRRSQFRELKEFIAGQAGNESLPTLLVVHGDHLQSHDMYVKRLANYTLPKLFDDTDPGPIKPFVLNWPEGNASLDDLDGGLRMNLDDVVPGTSPAADGDPGLNRRLAAHPGPVLVHTKLGALDATPDYESAIGAYCKFWSSWPALDPQQRLFIVLLVEHQRKRGLDLFKRVDRANNRLRSFLESCKANGVPDCERIDTEVLSELGNINQKHADNWVRREVEEFQPERFDKVRQRINQIYSGVEDLPMDHFAQQIQPALTG